MTRIRAMAVIMAMATFAATSAQAPKRSAGKLKVGDAAPTFQLADIAGKNKVQLADLRGKPVVLIFGSCT